MFHPIRLATLTGALLVAGFSLPAEATTKAIDLDGQDANGPESQCDLNVLQTFPVRIENVLTNRALADTFDSNWPSAGPGGFTTSLGPGTFSGVGSRWTWSTNQTVYAYTGTTCATDLCLLQTSGPDPLTSTCTDGCLEDGVRLAVGKTTNLSQVALSWTGGTPTYRLYRSTSAAGIQAPGNLLLQTTALQYTDVPPSSAKLFYRVRGATCQTPRPCETEAECAAAFEGSCVSRGPLSAPGRSLVPNSVTVSSASLTSSLITFFSPPTELFRITSTAQPGSFQETLVNSSMAPLTVTVPGSPPGCDLDCDLPPTTVTIPPGGSSTVCRPGGSLYREEPAAVRLCGGAIPGPEGTCGADIAHVTTGTFMRLLPDGGPITAAYLTPYAVQVLTEPSGDGLIQPGETADLSVHVVNAGLTTVGAAAATLTTSPVDLTDDGVDNPVTVSVLTAGPASYGTILGTEPEPDCDPVVLQPRANATAFRISVPAGHPPDTSTPLLLQFTGTAGRNAFAMEVPLALGIAHICRFGTGRGDYDGLTGLLPPMAKLVPPGDPLPSPLPHVSGSSVVPLRLRMSCNGVGLAAADVDPPQIVGVSEATRGPLDLPSLDLNAGADPDDPFFSWDVVSSLWEFDMQPSRLGTGTFTLTVRLAGRKDYVTGFHIP